MSDDIGAHGHALTGPEQIELASVEADSEIAKSKIRSQSVVAIVVGVITLAVVLSSAVLAMHERDVPASFGGLLPLLAGGLTTMLGVTIGNAAKQ